ncbi:bifunctional lysylphosphatidylglycerol flippase/synthetase MprF [uncultured Sneathiella sp.]|uniref:bifunctional lysylphosphatidylglycerol flippase/synthetase MprF n=1 Tax=uncultured Sneathiella sp. TaxID=879315 RepID=UPI0030ED3E7D|tara:strand:+ start:16216 stop:18861 length:2646 start_codon:yes stop_codon:yes gene_type:complete
MGSNRSPKKPLKEFPLFAFLGMHGSIVVSFLLFGLGAFAIYKILTSVNIHDVVAQLHQIAPSAIALAVFTTLAGYLALVGYDWSALRFIGKSAPLPTLIFGSFTAYAMGNTVGLSVFSGGAVRYRFYRGLGLDTSDVAVVSTFCAMSFGIGVTLVGFSALIYHPAALSPILPISQEVIRWASLALLLLIIGVGLWSSISKHSFMLGRFRIGLPEPISLGAQVLFSLADILLAATTLYILLPDALAIPFSIFVALFAAASVAGVLSHIPGGIGVFEGVMIAGLSTSPELVPGVAAALLAYRAIYYFLPFILSLMILAVLEAVQNSRIITAKFLSDNALGSLIQSMQPVMVIGLSALIFIGGAILILNGIMPIPKEILLEVQPIVSTSFFEVSNVIVGVIGGVLVILANALRRKVRAALWLTLASLLVAILSLLAQRLDYDLAAFLLFIAALMWVSRHSFYRRSRLTTETFSNQWLVLVGGLFFSAFLLFLFAHGDMRYQHHNWWDFAFDRNTPRAIRVFGAAAIGSLLILLAMALRPAKGARGQRGEIDFTLIETVIDQQENPDAKFVFTDDKEVLLSEDKDAFIMYAKQGRSFISLGDPIGNHSSFAALIDDFVDLADRENCRAAFYQAGSKLLPVYIDIGFTMNKLGEEAIILLAEFGLEGSKNRDARQANNRAEREGLNFDISGPPHSEGLLRQLNFISNEWLSLKNAQEKSFSLGRFDESYLQYFPLALVKKGSEIVAFANIMQTKAGGNATIDLMRHSSDAPAVTMDYLFIRLMLQLKEEGYREFSLGMAPLSGLEQTRHKRLWDRLGITIYHLGEHFYNFEGLRAYKNKFGPEWRPRYMATWGGVDPLLVAADVNMIVSGGVFGAIGFHAHHSHEE